VFSAKEAVSPLPVRAETVISDLTAARISAILAGIMSWFHRLSPAYLIMQIADVNFRDSARMGAIRACVDSAVARRN
jgi:hypothetical protein